MPAKKTEDSKPKLAGKDLEKKISEILSKSRISDPNGWKMQYYIEVNSPFEKPEKFYSQVLKELRDFGLKNIQKVSQQMSASPTSAFYGDISQRKAYAKETVDKGMATIGGMIPTIVKLVYSLKEFDLILDIFKKLASGDDLEVFAAEQNLRRIWLDEVDTKKGRGSMWQMQTDQGLEYVNLVDSFLTVQKLSDIDDLRSNDRMKRILKGRFQEYTIWKDAYKKDIMGRKEITRQFLKSQVESLKLQLDSIKPAYTMLKQLDIDSGANDPDLLVGFDTSMMKTKIRCLEGGEKAGKLLTAFLDVEFAFKTSPYPVQSDSGGRAFHHRFGTSITYTPYLMKNEDYEDFVKKELMSEIDFFKDIVGDNLKAIKDDLEKYLEGQEYIGKDREKKEDESKPLAPFEFLILPFKGLFEMIGLDFKKGKGDKKIDTSAFKFNNDKNDLKSLISGKAKAVYDNFKDENGFPTESPTLSF